MSGERMILLSSVRVCACVVRVLSLLSLDRSEKKSCLEKKREFELTHEMRKEGTEEWNARP